VKFFSEALGLLQGLQLWIRCRAPKTIFTFNRRAPNPKLQSLQQSQSLRRIVALVSMCTCVAAAPVSPQKLERLRFNNPGLVVDLGVGLWAWPMPMDWDRDGDLDLLVACPDKPYNGVYFFENPAGRGVKFPVFKPGKRIGPATADMTFSMVNGQPRLMSGRFELTKFRDGDWSTRQSWFAIPTVVPIKHPRDHFWRWADFDGDGAHDLVVGHGDWTEFGWFDKNEWWKGYNWQGVWQGAPVHGRVFWLRNEGSDAQPRLADPQPILADGKPVDVFGRPGQMFADFDGDGDLDLMCGEFLDGFTYFQNVGTRTAPTYAAGRRLFREGKQVVVELEMPVPHAIDWDGDGDTDMVVGDEDGRVALFEHNGSLVDGMPQFRDARYFQQEADEVKFGALVTPCGFDWDGDGDTDFIAGNTAGYIAFIENLSGPGVARPKFAAPQFLTAGGEMIRIMAGPNGSIQGPLEAKWGYTTQTVADWDGDGLPDIVANSIWGKVIWFRNTGTRTRPKLASAQPIEVEWPGAAPKPAWNWWNPQGKELVTQWRTTPVAVDWNKDGLIDLVMLDHEGYLCFWERAKATTAKVGRAVLSPPRANEDAGAVGTPRPASSLVVLPPKRVFADEGGKPLRLNAGAGGKSGRRKLCVVDWDGDGHLDLLVNSKNADFLRQVAQRDGQWRFKNEGPLASDNIEAHDVSPTTVDWNGDGVPDFVGGGEDGHFYLLQNPRTTRSEQ